MSDSDRGPVRPDPRVVAVDPVVRITTARASHTEDMTRRMRRYAISMAIRTACVAGFAIVFPLTHHWAAWLFVPGAVVLPYLAVLMANAGREKTPVRPTGLGPVQQPRPALGPRRDDAA
ncbi:DUF3099 domain-containing protein [Aquipuribacter sp. SD81]|uniref:DUF3099 domain-containing protein n=1 Tax=Aquipuribacter sp. SD81 TaxID=3127703 RepID=UPI00301921F8